MKKKIMKGLGALLCTLLCVCGFASCSELYNEPIDSHVTEPYTESYTETFSEADAVSDKPEDVQPETTASESPAPPQETAAYSETSEAVQSVQSVEKDGSYTSPEDVAEYIHTFGTLPGNFITKGEAKKLGWDSSKGNLWDVAYGKSIGGDRFGNYEKLLPEAEDRTYTECDVNYEGGYRGSERIIFSNDGLIFYTNDHYESFTQLY